MLAIDGIPTPEDLAGRMPPPERLAKGPVVMAECFQRIPCDPCMHACPRGAILPFKDINDTPVIDYNRCNGCALCVTRCPGLALFVLDYTYSAREAVVKMPYEFLPLPEPETTVTALDRRGEAVCAARVVKVVTGEKMDRTALIWLAVPKELAMEVRHCRVPQRGEKIDG